MAHSASTTRPLSRRTGTDETSMGTLVQSAMADVSTLVRSEIELAKAEVGTSVKKAGLGAALFAVAGVLLAFSAIFLLIGIAEFLTWLGLLRFVSYLIVFGALVLLAAVAGFIGYRKVKKIEKPERTMETLRDLPTVLHREAPGQRTREVPVVSNGRVERPGATSYSV